MFVACFSKLVYQGFIHLATGFFIYFANLSLFQHMVEGRSLFVHQTVGRYVFHIQLYGVPDIAHPLGKRFFGESEHQVDTDIADADVTEPVDGFFYLSGIMTAMQKV